MDSVTQAALGATIGQAGFRSMGRRAMLFGAICGTLPDLDSLFAGGDAWARLVAHRGWSHSLLVLPILAIPVGLIGWWVFRKKGRAIDWIHLAFWALVTHPILDAFTTYGTQLLAPFSDARFSWNTIGIIDPIYTFPLLFALFRGRKKDVDILRASKSARKALAWGCLYLALLFGVTQAALSGFEERMNEEGWAVEQANATPPALFPMLRHGVAKLESGDIITATITPWSRDGYPLRKIALKTSPRIAAALESERGQILGWFSDGYLSVTELPEGDMMFLDHRYGRFTHSGISIFAWFLPAASEPGEIVGRRESREFVMKHLQFDMKREIAEGWNIVLGTSDGEEIGKPQ